MPGAGGQQPQRTTFRPPWVKDGPNPLPMPAAPWTLNSRRESKTTTEEPPAFTKVTLKSVPKPVESMAPQPKAASPPPARKQSKITIIPSQPKNERVEKSEKVEKSGKSGSSAPGKTGENGRTVSTSQRPQQLERQMRVEKSRSRGENIPLSKSESTTGAPTLSKSSSRAAIPPPPPPRPPPPPPGRTILKDLPALTETQQKTLEMLKSRPRKRPDWACMMKEVESGKRLKHVQCNDRSAPLIERVNKVTADSAGKAHFVFESEKSNMHNQLLKQIQSGVKLKSVKTNDRSRPVLEGLRKFRRQLTIEEQMQKAEKASVDEVVPDELDDIDAVRDDLQSTKQMLALELRNKEALERDNKRLQARILNLEVEVERAKSQQNVQEHKQQDEKLAESLKREAEQARKDAERLEKDFARVADERDEAKNELEELKRMYAALERRMKAGMALAGCPSAKDVARIASQKSLDKADKSQTGPQGQDEEEEEEEEESTEDEDEEEDSEAAAEKRLVREFKLLKTKIKNFKDKAVNAKKERHALREQIKQQNKLLKEEKKKFKHLQKEVDKMAKLMGDTDDDEEEEHEENEQEEEDDDEETESEEESETDESELDDVWDSDDEDDPPEKRRVKLQGTVKKHEGRLAALKKGNYLLKAQVDRLKDDLIKQREESISLQEDLDSVLAELG
ncbi:glutamic acid-rich protein-like isoform X2 [Venturia canescens]|uniref:glutamic acid-rich protein-like isoform X2 n=1 Tax=Venturia canescens TaxID=32260 RepID=UPI001C9D12A8|nr:glutamic acid-rich protein-like isoform X2 [Venturia canescens]